MPCEDSIGADTRTRDNTLDELCDVEPDEKTEKQLLREMPCEDSIGADLDSTTEKGVDSFINYLYKLFIL